ncbi:hypothetical protein ACFW04_005094 [Cataglyphis niger]
MSKEIISSWEYLIYLSYKLASTL